MRTLVFGFFLLLACVVAHAQEKGEPGEVKWTGEMRKVMRDGDLSGAVNLDALAKWPHLYALGPLEGLRGEVTIWDGKPSIAFHSDGKASISEKFEGKACFLVYAQVPAWQDFELPAKGLDKAADLEACIQRIARKAEIDTDKPFAFLLRGKVATAKIHIVNKTDDAPFTPKDHDRIKVPFEMKDCAVEILGFYSDKHAGIFTHHDSNVHMHLKTADGKLSGHVDSVVPAEGVRILLAKAARR
jgi:acetolactate decarboxylase